MGKLIGILLACTAAGASACSFAAWSTYQYDTLALGEVRVVKITSGEDIFGNPYTNRDTVGISRLTDFDARVRDFLDDSSLVFVGEIDSVIESLQDTSVPGVTPLYDFSAGSSGEVRFFARLKIDTVLRGSLPADSFWVRGRVVSGAGCGMTPSAHKNKLFLNVSDGLSVLSDLKLPWALSNESGRPAAHWFDGRYLESPEFPGLKLDITTVLPGYPSGKITGIHASKLPTRILLRAPGKAYLPDGRLVPESDRRTGLAPLLK